MQQNISQSDPIKEDANAKDREDATTNDHYIKSDWNTITLQQPVIIQTGHSICTIALSSDDRYIASAGVKDDLIKIWDLITGKQVGNSMNGHTNCINQINYSKCGNYIVSCSDDKTIRQWNVQNQLQIGQALKGHDSQVRGVQYTIDQRYIVSCSCDQTIRIWDSKTGKERVNKRINHTSDIVSLSLSSIQSNVVFGDSDGTVTIWNYEKHQQSGQSLYGHKSRIISIQYSTEGKLIGSRGDDEFIKLWDAMLLQQIRSFHVDSNWLNLVNFSRDMRYIIIASRGWDSTVRLWNLMTGKQIGEALKYYGYHCIQSTQLSLDGKYIITGGLDAQIRITLAPIDS